jgi:molecular chaperone GrpE
MSRRRRKRTEIESGDSEKVTGGAEERVPETAEGNLEHKDGSDAESSDAERSAGGDAVDVTFDGGPNEELPRMQARAEEFKNLLQHKQAEFENYRKRMDRERADNIRYAAFDVVKEVLPVLDNLERAVQASLTGTEKQLREGVEIIQKQFSDVLKKQGLSEIESKGQPFDPHVHEAVGRVETDDHPEEQIVEVFQKGYRFKDRLLRPSMVSVAHPASDAGATPDSPDSEEESEDEVVRHED